MGHYQSSSSWTAHNKCLSIKSTCNESFWKKFVIPSRKNVIILEDGKHLKTKVFMKCTVPVTFQKHWNIYRRILKFRMHGSGEMTKGFRTLAAVAEHPTSVPSLLAG